MTKDPRMTTATDADIDAKRALYNGFGNTYTIAVEFAVTPFIVGLIGYLIDRSLGTGRVFMIGLGALAAVGMLLRTWYRYVATMREEEAKAPWAKR